MKVSECVSYANDAIYHRSSVICHQISFFCARP